jgi:hypothetical protein
VANALCVAGSNSNIGHPALSLRASGPDSGTASSIPLRSSSVFLPTAFASTETKNRGRWHDFGFVLGIDACASNQEIRKAVGA